MVKANTARDIAPGLADEDWSQITDRVARKRIQNRIAQRNYRGGLPEPYLFKHRQVFADSQYRTIGRNLKQRLQALERHCGMGQVVSGKTAAHCASPEQGIEIQAGSSDPVVFPAADQQQNGKHEQQFTDYFLDNGQSALEKLDDHGHHHHHRPPPLLGVMPRDEPQEHVPIPTFQVLGNGSEHSSCAHRFSRNGGVLDENDWGKISSWFGDIDRSLPLQTNIVGDMIEEQNHDRDILQDHSASRQRAGSSPSPFTSRKGRFSGLTTPADSIGCDNHQISNDRNAQQEHCSPTECTPEINLAAGLDRIDTVGSSSLPDIPSHTASLQTRIEFLLECSKLVGFARLDTAVSHYYTAEFPESSIAFSAQRLSRRRHLPEVLACIRDKRASWSQWEAQGYCDEILKSSEQVLLDEFRSANAHECIDLIDRQVMQDLSNHKANSDEGFDEGPGFMAKRILQTKLPNLWSLITVITAETTSSNQTDQACVILMTVSLLYFYGKVSLDLLQCWVDSCAYHQKS